MLSAPNCDYAVDFDVWIAFRQRSWSIVLCNFDCAVLRTPNTFGLHLSLHKCTNIRRTQFSVILFGQSRNGFRNSYPLSRQPRLFRDHSSSNHPNWVWVYTLSCCLSQKYTKDFLMSKQFDWFPKIDNWKRKKNSKHLLKSIINFFLFGMIFYSKSVNLSVN